MTGCGIWQNFTRWSRVGESGVKLTSLKMPVNSECSQGPRAKAQPVAGPWRAFLRSSQAWAIWQGLLIFSLWGWPPMSLPYWKSRPPALKAPGEEHISPCSLFHLPYPHFLSTSSGETPATATPNSWGEDHPFLWPLQDHYIKKKYPMKNIPHVCVWVLPRVR